MILHKCTKYFKRLSDCREIAQTVGWAFSAFYTPAPHALPNSM